MSNEIVQANYEQLAQIAGRFGQWSQANADLVRRVDQSASRLIEGGWKGRGVEAFSAEMRSTLLPAMLRLTLALDEAQKTTAQISALLRVAEEEAAQPFRQNGYFTPVTSPDGQTSILIGPSFPGQGLETQVSNRESFWRKFQLKGDGDVWQFDRAAEPGKKSQFDPGIGIKYGIEGAAFGDQTRNGFSALGGEAGVQAGFGREGLTVGVYGEGYVGRGKADGVLGNSDLGLTGGVEGKVLAAEGFAGIRNNSIGASIGGTLASVEGSVGTNVAGYNVSLIGEAGLKAEAGLSVGQKTEIKLPFITVGFTFGKAIGK